MEITPPITDHDSIVTLQYFPNKEKVDLNHYRPQQPNKNVQTSCDGTNQVTQKLYKENKNNVINRSKRLTRKNKENRLSTIVEGKIVNTKRHIITTGLNPTPYSLISSKLNKKKYSIAYKKNRLSTVIEEGAPLAKEPLAKFNWHKSKETLRNIRTFEQATKTKLRPEGNNLRLLVYGPSMGLDYDEPSKFRRELMTKHRERTKSKETLLHRFWTNLKKPVSRDIIIILAALIYYLVFFQYPVLEALTEYLIYWILISILVLQGLMFFCSICIIASLSHSLPLFHSLDNYDSGKIRRCRICKNANILCSKSHHNNWLGHCIGQTNIGGYINSMVILLIFIGSVMFMIAVSTIIMPWGAINYWHYLIVIILFYYFCFVFRQYKWPKKTLDICQNMV